MFPAFPRDPDPDQHNVPALPEVEFALVLQRIIGSVSSDPAELRQSIYELARMKLRKEGFKSNPEEAARLAKALETAIIGVEEFSRRTAERDSDLHHRPRLAETYLLDTAPREPAEIQPPRRTFVRPPRESDHAPSLSYAGDSPGGTAGERSPSVKGRFVIGTTLVLLILGSAALQRVGFWEVMRYKIASFGTTRLQSVVGVSTPAPSAPPAASAGALQPETAPVAKNSSAGQVPLSETGPTETRLPKTYGTYAAVNNEFIELDLLPIAVPDNRVAISSAIRTPSRTVLPDGSPAFIVFRRDLASIPPEQIEARAVAKIKRTMKFDANAKTPGYVTEDIWSIRNVAYRMKVSAVAGSSEMIAIRPEAELPPGRYALALKRQAYDFTVAGPITDPAQCLDRIEATNGTFYAPCDKR